MALVADLTARRLVAALAAEQARGRLPSVCAAVTRDRSLVWRGSVGEATGVPGLSPADLQYRVGSITKTITAVLVLQLRDEGRLSLNDPVGLHLPEVDLDGVTLRTLLAHTAGLPAEPAGPWWERVEGGTLDELVAGLAGLRAPFEPGRTHHYSNLGYGLLGAVAARLRGTSWWECVTEWVLVPLGMLRTTYDPFFPFAQGYSVDPYLGTLAEEPAADTAAMAPAGQVWSTVLDLATWADFLVTGHPDVLAAETLAEMATPQTSGYGLGLRLLPGGSGTLAGHTGSMPGFQASLFVDRVRRTGVVVLANSTTGLRADRIGAELLAVLEESEPTLPYRWRPTTEVPPAVREVAGVWHWGNTAHVFTWDGALLHSAHLNTGEHKDSYRLNGDEFVGVAGYHDGERLVVVRREDGSVSHLECATFVYTRTPYDPAAPIPGGLRRAFRCAGNARPLNPERAPTQHEMRAISTGEGAQRAWLTVDMLKSGTRRAGVAVRGK